jgi:hypothetical protein
MHAEGVQVTWAGALSNVMLASGYAERLRRLCCLLISQKSSCRNCMLTWLPRTLLF